MTDVHEESLRIKELQDKVKIIIERVIQLKSERDQLHEELDNTRKQLEEAIGSLEESRQIGELLEKYEAEREIARNQIESMIAELNDILNEN